MYKQNEYVNGTEQSLAHKILKDAKDSGAISNAELNNMLYGGIFPYIKDNDTLSVPNKVLNFSFQKEIDNIPYSSTLIYYYDFELLDSDLK